MISSYLARMASISMFLIRCMFLIISTKTAWSEMVTPVTPDSQSIVYECDDQWISQPGYPTCYKLDYRFISYESAVQTCSAMGAQLLTIETEEENKYIGEQMPFKSIAFLSIRWRNGNWSWPQTETEVLDNWAEDQPKDHECAYLSGTGKWTSAMCDSLHLSGATEYICEQASSELPSCAGDRWFGDSSLPNISCYKISLVRFQNRHTYIENTCVKSGGDLATIETYEENRYLANVLGVSRHAFIGLKHENGIWRWPTGATDVLDNWNQGEPKTYYCATIKSGGLWRHAMCQQSLDIDMLICEKPARVVSLREEDVSTAAATPISFQNINHTKVSEVSDDSEIIIYVASPICAVVLIVIGCIVWRLCIRGQTLHPPGNRKDGAQLSLILKSILEDEVQRKLTDLLVARSAIDVQELLGQGAFGLVYKATYTIGDRVHDKQTVAIKTLKTNCSGTQISGLAEEAVVMSNFEHVHVLSIIAMCIRTEDGVPMLILPFMDNGDLRTYLRQFSSGNQEKTAPDEKQLVTFCLHVARGMEYLAEQKFVHRDLAARNCMLDAQLIVKIADFGLSRDIYTSSYYRLDQQKCLPVKWLPLESLQYQTFTVQSDVWSFGVTMWEIMTLGMMPYTTVDNIDMKLHLQSGARLERPDNCSNYMYDLMLSCWADIPESRPTFSNISTILADKVAEMSEYIELSVDSHNYASAQNDGHTLGRELITPECGMDSATAKPNIRDHSEIVGADLTKTESTSHTSSEDVTDMCEMYPRHQPHSHILEV